MKLTPLAKLFITLVVLGVLGYTGYHYYGDKLKDWSQKGQGGGGEAKRCLMVLSDVVTVKAGAIVGFDDLETVVVEFLQRHAARVDVVENSEFHASPPMIRECFRA